MSAVTSEAWAETEEGHEPVRLLALSDGLFATVLTILVLDLKLPDLAPAVSAGNLRPALVDLGPHLFAYVLTFIITGLFWLAHHRTYVYIIRTNRLLAWFNLMFLLPVGLVPFSTAGLANHFSTITWTIYALNMIGGGIMLTVTWGYAVSHGLVDPRMPDKFKRYTAIRYLIMPAVFLVSCVVQVAFPQAYLSPWLLLFTPVLQIFLDRLFYGRQPQPTTRRVRAQEWVWRLVGVLPLIVLIAFTVWLLT